MSINRHHRGDLQCGDQSVTFCSPSPPKTPENPTRGLENRAPTATRLQVAARWLRRGAIVLCAAGISVASVRGVGQEAASSPAEPAAAANRPATPRPMPTPSPLPTPAPLATLSLGGSPPLETDPGLSTTAPEPSSAADRSTAPASPAAADGEPSAAGGEPSAADEESSAADGEPSAAARYEAAAFAERMVEYLTLGPPLEAKLRQRVWAAGREVVEVGRYQQGGRGSGRLRMELQVPIADGKGRWQQTCDGRLAWTREELAGEIRVRRVDLGKLEEATAAATGQRVPPRLRVGGLVEIIDRIQADFDLQLSEGHIDGRPMLVLKGMLRDSAAQALLAGNPGDNWPALVPRQVRIAVAADSLAAPLPARIEFWTEPGGRLISLLEIYDVAQIEPPGVDQFRFEPGGHEFSNETEMYIARFGMALAATPLGSTPR